MTVVRSSARTRAAVLEAAQRRFASQGYAATTVRAVAKDADIDPALVMRHFGSKEGLFAAATEVDLSLGSLGDVADDQVGAALARRFLEVWESGPSAPAVRVLLTCALAGSEPAERIRDIFGAQVLPAVERFQRQGRSRAARREAEERAVLLASQVLGFALARYVLRLEPAASMSADRVVGVLGPALQAHLTGPLRVTPGR